MRDEKEERKKQACIVLYFSAAHCYQVSIHIVEGATKDRQSYAAVFRDFIKKFRAIIDNQASSHRELTVAIKGYGYFAAVSTAEF